MVFLTALYRPICGFSQQNMRNHSLIYTYMSQEDSSVLHKYVVEAANHSVVPALPFSEDTPT